MTSTFGWKRVQASPTSNGFERVGSSGTIPKSRAIFFHPRDGSGSKHPSRSSSIRHESSSSGWRWVQACNAWVEQDANLPLRRERVQAVDKAAVCRSRAPNLGACGLKPLYCEVGGLFRFFASRMMPNSHAFSAGVRICPGGGFGFLGAGGCCGIFIFPVFGSTPYHWMYSSRDSSPERTYATSI
jgi:hypothetical protein